MEEPTHAELYAGIEVLRATVERMQRDLDEFREEWRETQKAVDGMQRTDGERKAAVYASWKTIVCGFSIISAIGAAAYAAIDAVVRLAAKLTGQP